jgi:hypothetical protein
VHLGELGARPLRSRSRSCWAAVVGSSGGNLATCRGLNQLERVMFCPFLVEETNAKREPRDIPKRGNDAVSKCFEPTLPSSDKKCDGAGGSPILPKAGFKFRRYSRMSALRAKADLRHSAGNEVHIEVSHCFQASSLGDTPQGEISPLGLRKNAVTRPCS